MDSFATIAAALHKPVAKIVLPTLVLAANIWYAWNARVGRKGVGIVNKKKKKRIHGRKQKKRILGTSRCAPQIIKNMTCKN